MKYNYIMKHVSIPLKADEAPSHDGWLQWDKKSMRPMQQLALKSPIAMSLLILMIDHMSRSNALMVSQKGLATKMAVTERSIRAAISLLQKMRFIDVVKVGTANVYVVNTQIAWQGNRGHRYAHFTAEVLAFESEQVDELSLGKDDLIPVPRLMPNERLLVQNEPLDPPDQQELHLP